MRRGNRYGGASSGERKNLLAAQLSVPRILREFEIAFEEGEKAEWKVSTAWFTPQKMPMVKVRRRHGPEV